MTATRPLEVEGLSVRLGHERVLVEVGFRVQRGEFVGIAGPNGGGKSTLLRAILGLIPSERGRIRLFGEEPPVGRRRVAYLAQHAAHIDPAFPASAREIASLGRVGRGSLLRRANAQDRALVETALADVGVAHLGDRLVGNLSGGERQRVLLAKALASEPEMLILDEPTTGIDPVSRESFHRLLRELNETKGLTVLLVSHDTEFLAHVARRVLVVDRRIHYDGDPGHIPDHPHGPLNHHHGGHA